MKRPYRNNRIYFTREDGSGDYITADRRRINGHNVFWYPSSCWERENIPEDAILYTYEHDKPQTLVIGNPNYGDIIVKTVEAVKLS